MNLSEDEADSLFPDSGNLSDSPQASDQRSSDDRGQDANVKDLSHWLTIEQCDDGVVIDTEHDTYDLSEQQVEDMMDHFNWDSIWWAIFQRTKCLRYLRNHIE